MRPVTTLEEAQQAVTWTNHPVGFDGAGAPALGGSQINNSGVLCGLLVDDRGLRSGGYTLDHVALGGVGPDGVDDVEFVAPEYGKDFEFGFLLRDAPVKMEEDLLLLTDEFHADVAVDVIQTIDLTDFPMPVPPEALRPWWFDFRGHDIVSGDSGGLILDASMKLVGIVAWDQEEFRGRAITVDVILRGMRQGNEG